MGVSRAAWANYEAEKSSPSLDLLIRLQKEYGADLNYIASGALHRSFDVTVLADVIRGVEESNIEIDPLSRAKLIAALYADRIKTLEQDENARPAIKGKGSRF